MAPRLMRLSLSKTTVCALGKPTPTRRVNSGDNQVGLKNVTGSSRIHVETFCRRAYHLPSALPWISHPLVEAHGAVPWLVQTTPGHLFWYRAQRYSMRWGTA